MAIFIGGCARTGTTLMQGILCSDSSAFPFTKESLYLYSLVCSYIQGRLLWSSHVDDYFDSLEDYINFNKNIIAEYIYHIRDRWGWDKEIIQKAPQMTDIFPELCYLMDGIESAKFIVMIRDPRDTIASMKKVQDNLSPENKLNTKELLRGYIKRYETIIKNKSHFGDNLILLQYEKLVSNQQKEIEKLRLFTGLSLDKGVSGWTGKEYNQDAFQSPLWNKSISRDSIGNYKTKLSDDEIKYIESQKTILNDFFDMDIFLADCF